MDALKKAGSVRAASDAVLTGYEKPADQSETVKKKRAEYGEGYYKKYATGNGTKYYRVRKRLYFRFAMFYAPFRPHLLLW